jgi:hypothetical protein
MRMCPCEKFLYLLVIRKVCPNKSRIGWTIDDAMNKELQFFFSCWRDDVHVVLCIPF